MRGKVDICGGGEGKGVSGEGGRVEGGNKKWGWKVFFEHSGLERVRRGEIEGKGRGGEEVEMVKK